MNKLTLEVTFQGCADVGVCYMPIKETVSLDLSDESFNWWGTTSPPDKTTPFISEQNRIADSLKTGSVWPILLSFLGFGLLLAFTPCIFPMLPILSGIVAGQGSSLNTRRAFWLSLSYVLASALTYTVFGVLAGLFGSNLQALFQEPWVIMAFSGVFVLLALSMFGGIQIQIPSFIQTKVMAISSKQQGGRLWGAVIMGILSALAIGPCVTAPLTGALIYIGQTGDAYLGGMALFALGLGMGIPLIIIGTYAGKLLPKAGAWMNVTKVIFGVGLLAVAVWLLSRIMSPTATLALWSLLAIFPVMLMIWKKHWKGAGLIAAAYGILLWIGDLRQTKLTLCGLCYVMWPSLAKNSYRLRSGLKRSEPWRNYSKIWLKPRRKSNGSCLIFMPTGVPHARKWRFILLQIPRLERPYRKSCWYKLMSRKILQLIRPC